MTSRTKTLAAFFTVGLAVTLLGALITTEAQTGVGREQARRDRHRMRRFQAPRGAQHARLGLELEAIPRLDLDGGHALGQQ